MQVQGATFSKIKNAVFMRVVQVVKVLSKNYYIEKIKKKNAYREVYETAFTTCTFLKMMGGSDA